VLRFHYRYLVATVEAIFCVPSCPVSPVPRLPNRLKAYAPNIVVPIVNDIFCRWRWSAIWLQIFSRLASNFSLPPSSASIKTTCG
jgi:hypothetical protein